MLKNIVLASVLLFLLGIASCGTSEPEFDLSLVFYEWESHEENITDLAPSVHTPDSVWQHLRYYERDPERRHDADISPFYGETLTILVDHMWYNRHRMRTMADNFIRMHPGVNIEFVMMRAIRDMFDSRYNDYEDLICLLRAGTAPILIQTRTTQTREIVREGLIQYHRRLMNAEMAGFFANWLPVMENHPGFEPSEWNMNVLNASRIHGELFQFPAFQQPLLVTANRNIPGLAQTFEAKDTVSVSELIDLYNWHGGFGAGDYFINSLLHWFISERLFPDFFNSNDGTAAFDTEEFKELLRDLYFSVNFHDDMNFEINHIVSHWLFVEDRLFRENFFFRTLHDGFGRFESFSFLEYEAYFVNPLPVVSNDGRLKIHTHWAFESYSWILNTHDPILQALAADFLLFMAGVFGGGVDYRNSPFSAHTSGWGIYGIPARLSDTTNFEMLVERRLQHLYANDRRIPGTASRWREGYCPRVAAETIEAFVNRLGNMEMVNDAHSECLTIILTEEASHFASGTISAEETSRRLQERVTAHFLEWNRR